MFQEETESEGINVGKLWGEMREWRKHWKLSRFLQVLIFGLAASLFDFGTDLNDLTLLGDTVIGDGCATSTLLIQAATTVKCDILADPDNTVNLGSPTKRFANIYTGDLHFSNEGSGGNDIDGTTGNWTLQEGDENMFFINNKTGMKFRVVMEPVG